MPLEVEENAGDAPHCPGCGSRAVMRWGYSQSGLQRRRCRDCGKTFNAAHGTGLAHTQKRDVLLAFTKQMLMPSPMSCREAAEHFDVHRMTAWRWRQKVLKAIEDAGSEELGGIVEADETFQRESRKGSREWKRHEADPENVPEPPRHQWYQYKRKNWPMKRGLSRWQVPILTVLDRSGGGRAEVLRGLGYVHIGPVLHRHLQCDAILCSDKAHAYEKFTAKTGIRHVRIPTRKDRHIVDQTFHVQNVNALHSRFKDFLKPFRGPAKWNLRRYVAWFMFREQQPRDEEAFRELFQRVLAQA